MLTLINFVVITKGATRIAEVAARFTLDAMPGKQMSIDADLNAGLISETDARRRRSEIEREADFYGAMDGASKFVRGDAIAGVVIIFINIVGGLIIGVLQQGMDITDAARNYTLLTIGDGLVTQVPALIISTAAGMLVTRSTSSSNLGQDITEQLFVQPKAIGTAAAILFFFALIPGMPKVSFLLIAAGAGLLAWRLVKAAPTAQESAEAEAAPPSAIETVDLLLPLDPLEIEVGYGLIGYVDVAQGGELLQRIKSLRRQLAVEMGFVIPAIHIRDNLQLKPNQYTVILKGVEIARGELLPGHWLALTSDKTPRVKGIETKEPAFGLPAVWIAEKEKESVQARGVVVVDPATVVTTHLTEIVKAHADELLGRQEVQSLIDNLAKTHPRVIEELIPKVVSAGTLHRVLQRLLRERISIRDLLTVLETLADYAPLTKNLDILTGYVRQALARTITKQYRDSEGGITVVMLSPEIEDKISQSVQHTEYESYLSVDPNWVQKVVRGVQKFLGRSRRGGCSPSCCARRGPDHFGKSWKNSSEHSSCSRTTRSRTNVNINPGDCGVGPCRSAFRSRQHTEAFRRSGANSDRMPSCSRRGSSAAGGPRCSRSPPPSMRAPWQAPGRRVPRNRRRSPRPRGRRTRPRPAPCGATSARSRPCWPNRPCGLFPTGSSSRCGRCWTPSSTPWVSSARRSSPGPCRKSIITSSPSGCRARRPSCS